MVNWQDIHSEFTEDLQKEWENKGFSYEEVKDWIRTGLGANEADLADWLESRDYAPEWVLNQGNAEELRQKFQRERESNNKGKD